MASRSILFKKSLEAVVFAGIDGESDLQSDLCWFFSFLSYGMGVDPFGRRFLLFLPGGAGAAAGEPT